MIPGYSSSAELRMPDRRCTLACLAETYLFAREGIREHSVGHAAVELAVELERIADTYGVRPRELDFDSMPPCSAPVAATATAAAPAAASVG